MLVAKWHFQPENLAEFIECFDLVPLDAASGKPES